MGITFTLSSSNLVLNIHQSVAYQDMHCSELGFADDPAQCCQVVQDYCMVHLTPRQLNISDYFCGVVLPVSTGLTQVMTDSNRLTV